jgi:hypothetical protein
MDISALDKIVLNRARDGRLSIHCNIVTREAADRIVADAVASAAHADEHAEDVVILRVDAGRIVTTQAWLQPKIVDRLVKQIFDEAVF